MYQHDSSSNCHTIDKHVDVSKPAVDWTAGLNPSDTVVVCIGAGTVREVVGKLAARGFGDHVPAMVVKNTASPARKEIWCTLDTLENATTQSVEGPALIIIGQALATARHSAESAEQSDDQTDRFLEYGNSWFR